MNNKKTYSPFQHIRLYRIPTTLARAFLCKEVKMPKFIPTEEQKELLFKLHSEGKSVQAISKEISFTGSGPIKRILLEMGCTLFEKRPNLTEDEIKEIQNLRISGVMSKDISQKYNISVAAIWRHCKPITHLIKTPIRKLQDEGFKLCNYCEETKPLDQFYKKSGRENEYLTGCKDCRFSNRKIEQVCVECGVGFTLHYPRTCCDECHNPKNFERTYESVYEESLKYTSRGDFRSGSPCDYAWAAARKLLPEICAHMGEKLQSGKTRRDFRKACKKHGGFGTLYLIKMFNSKECFYKTGRTCQTISARYSGVSRNFGYDYEIIWQIDSDPDTIFDLEYEKHRETKTHRYQPELWPNESLETFKCHGNSKLLRKPTL